MKAILTVALMCLFAMPALPQRGGYPGGRVLVRGGVPFGRGFAPVYGGGWGGGWGPGWGYGYPFGGYGPAGPAVIYIAPPGPPIIPDYDGFPPAEYPPASPIYLIALRNGQVFAAVSYGVVVDTLQFITIQGENKKTPVDTVDWELTRRLNYERGIPIPLPD